jgi:hypothetical protein
MSKTPRTDALQNTPSMAGGPGKCRHCGRTLPNVSLHEQHCGMLPELTKFADEQQSRVVTLEAELERIKEG